MYKIYTVVFLTLAFMSTSVFARGMPVLPRCDDPDNLPEQAAEQARTRVQYPCAVIVEYWPSTPADEITELLNRGAAKTRLTLNNNVQSLAISSANSYRAIRNSNLVLNVYPDRINRVIAKPDKTGKPGNDSGSGDTSGQSTPVGVTRVNGGKFPGASIAIVNKDLIFTLVLPGGLTGNNTM